MTGADEASSPFGSDMAATQVSMLCGFGVRSGVATFEGARRLTGNRSSRFAGVVGADECEAGSLDVTFDGK